MGRMVYSLWANYISLTSAAILFAMGIHACAYPMITFESARPVLDVLVKPAPILPIILSTVGLFIGAIEWPLPGIRENLGAVAQNYGFRAVFYAIVAVLALLVMQTVNGGLYLLIAAACYAKAVMNGEEDMKPARRT